MVKKYISMIRMGTAVETALVVAIFTFILIYILEAFNMTECIIEMGHSRQRMPFDPKATTEKIRAIHSPLERSLRESPYYEKHYGEMKSVANKKQELIEEMRILPFAVIHKSPQIAKNHQRAKEEGPSAYFQRLFSKFVEQAPNKDLKNQYTRHKHEIIETALFYIISLCFNVKNVPEMQVFKFNATAFELLIQSSKKLCSENVFFPVEEFKNITLVGIEFFRLPINALEFFDNAVGIESLLIVRVTVLHGLSFEFPLKNLKRLKIYESLLKDIPNIEGLVNLEVLDMRKNNVSNIQLNEYNVDDEDFKPMYHVKCIDLRSNPLSGGNVEKIHQVFPKLESLLFDEDNSKIDDFKTNLTRRYCGRIIFSAI